jgi:MFS family permease
MNRFFEVRISRSWFPWRNKVLAITQEKSCVPEVPVSKNVSKKQNPGDDVGLNGSLPLKHETSFWWYLAAQLISFAGTMLQNAALALLIVEIVGRAHAAKHAGYQWALGLLPGLFLGPCIGVFIDRFPKRLILMLCAFVGGVQALILAFLAHAHIVSLWHIYALSLVIGFVNMFDSPTRSAIIKDMMRNKNNVPKAIKLFSSIYPLADIFGKGIAGYLIILTGYTGTFVINAASFVIFIAMLLRVICVYHIPEVRLGYIADVASGTKYFFFHKKIFLCSVISACMCIFGFTYNLLLPMMNKYIFGGNEISYSHLAVVNGIGSFFGSYLNAVYFGKKYNHVQTVLIGILATAGGIVILAFSHSVHAAMCAVFFSGFGFMLAFNTIRAHTLHMVDAKRSGIVSSCIFSLFYGSMAVSALILAPCADRFGARSVLLFCSGALIILFVYVLFSKKAHVALLAEKHGHQDTILTGNALLNK